MTMSEQRTISVIGLGYIGLPTAAMFASRGIHVVGVDVNRKAVDTINRGEAHIVEPDLDLAVQSAVRQGHLRATTAPEPAEAFLIAVPTPFRGDGREPDLSYIEAASRAVAPVLAPGNLVVLESTSPVGTTEQMAAWLAEARPDLTFPQSHGEQSDIRIAHCPERVLPGKVIQELVANDRVIGGLTARCSREATDLYRAFVQGECIVTDARTAEMAKLTENSFRDVNIAFANELSVICDRLGIDVWELIALANRHPRVNILRPGPGVGGHCIAVDPWFIVSKTPEEARLIRAAREVNDAKPEWVLDKIAKAAAGFKEPLIACMGLAFKPDIDDLRESPSLAVAMEVGRRRLGRLAVCEPYVDGLPEELRAAGACAIALDEVREADIVVILTGHSQFQGIEDMLGKGAVLIDACGVTERGRKDALSSADRTAEKYHGI